MMNLRKIGTLLLVVWNYGLCLGQQSSIDLIKFCRDNADDRIDVRVRINDDDCDRIGTTLFGERLPGLGFDSLTTMMGEGIFNQTINGSGSNRWKFYFVVTDSCNADSTYSDTFNIDLFPPNDVSIDSVSIVDGRLVMGWSGSNAPDLKGYIIYLDDGSGLSQTLDSTRDEIDTLTGFNLLADSLRYRLGAYDSCDVGTGPLDPHKPALLRLEDFDPCERIASIGRTNYVGWNMPSYDLMYQDTNSSTWKLLLPNLQTNETLLLDSIERGIFIKVRVRDTINNFSSSSNILRLELESEASIDTMQITGVKYQDRETLNLSWYCQESALIDRFLIQRSTETLNAFNTFQSIQYNGNEGRASLSVNSVFERSTFRILVMGKCGDTLAISNVGTEIRIELDDEKNGPDWNDSLDSERLINWNDYSQYQGGVKYRLYRKIDREPRSAVVTDLQRSEYRDEETIELGVDSVICYEVVAYPNSTDSVLLDSSISDIRCYSFNFHEDLPNAVVFNDDTKMFEIPVEGIDENESEIRIFNRWGELVFKGWKWNGGFNNNEGDICQEGQYFYTGVISLRNGKVYYISSPLAVIR